MSSSHIFRIFLAIAHKQMTLSNISGHFFNLILKESSNNVKFNYFCKYCKTNPSKGGDVVQTDEGIVQFYLDPMVKKPITRGKGAGVNVQAKSLTTYFCRHDIL